MIECNQPSEVYTITRQPPHEPENIAGSNFYADRSDVFFQRDIMRALGVLLPKGVSVGAALRESIPPEVRFQPGMYARERLVHLLNVIGEYKLHEYHIGTTTLTAKKLQVLLTLLRDDDWEIGYEKDDQAYKDIGWWRRHSGQSSFIEPMQVWLVKDWKDPLLNPFDPFKDGKYPMAEPG